MNRLNIVIPMAGLGSRFANVGYDLPKPLIPVQGVPMIRHVINNLRPSCNHRFIFICQKNHVSLYSLREKLNLWAPGSEVIELDGVTDGAACTVLMAESQIDSGEPLMIANSDQWVDVDINEYLRFASEEGLDGCIMTMNANDPKWSFVRVDGQGRVAEVVEKKVISNEATVGIYNFTRGHDFVRASRKMIGDNLRVNGEFYVAPTYNQLVDMGMHVKCYNIGSLGNGMYGLGTPEDLMWFENMATKPQRWMDGY